MVSYIYANKDITLASAIASSDNIFAVPKFYDNKNLVAWIDKERGVISQEQYDKILLGE